MNQVGNTVTGGGKVNTFGLPPEQEALLNNNKDLNAGSDTRNTPTIPVGPVTQSVGSNINDVRPSWMIGDWRPEEANIQKATYTNMPEILKYNQGIVSGAVNPTVATPTPTPTAPTAPATLPGYMTGESKEQRRARIRKNRLAKGEIT